MFWILLFGLFAGSMQSATLDTSAKRYAKKFIVDKERKKEIIDILEANEEQQEIYRSDQLWVTELKILNGKRWATREEFNDLIDRYMTSRAEWDENAIRSGLEIRSKITDPEWSQIVAAAAGTHEAMQKQRDKYVAKVKKYHEEIDEEIAEAVNDDARFAQIMESVSAFEDKMLQIKAANDQFNHRDNATLRNREATFDDFMKVQEEKNILMRELFNTYVDTRLEVVEIATNDEWDAVNQALVKIFGV